MKQQTLLKPIQCAGVGLHTGEQVTLRLCPAKPNTGIIFKRTDIQDQNNEIPALWHHVTQTQLCTKIVNDEDVSVSTIEHVMSALRSSYIHNAIVEIDGPEIPIMDGSAEPFCFMIDCAGVIEQDADVKHIKIMRDVTVAKDGKQASFSPTETASFEFDLDYAHEAIGQQSRTLKMVNGNARTDISRARTFGFAHEVEHLRKLGLARGGSLDNAIVLDQEKVMNDNGLRYGDEFVRHKILDAVGDIYLAGMPIIGAYHGIKAGHAINNDLLHEVFSDPKNYKIV